MDGIAALHIIMQECVLPAVEQVHSTRQRPDPEIAFGIFKYFPDTVVADTRGIIRVVLIPDKFFAVEGVQTSEVRSYPKRVIAIEAKTHDDVRAEAVGVAGIV